MLLYLVRHGQAVSEAKDRSRPLSAEGQREVRRTARFVHDNFRVLIGSIHHSPKTRAAQTAGIMAAELKPLSGPLEADGLRPMDDPADWAERITNLEMDTMLVGHLPHLSRLASTLLAWNPGVGFVDFTPGTVVCLEGSDREWLVKWMVSPEALRS